MSLYKSRCLIYVHDRGHAYINNMISMNTHQYSLIKQSPTILLESVDRNNFAATSTH